MIDLHVHLDGSMSAEMILKLAAAQGVRLPAESSEGLRPYISVSSACRSLNDYLKCFNIPCAVLQTPRAVYHAILDVANGFRAQGLLYAEIRFAPQKHMKRGFSQEEIVSAAIEGLRQSALFSNLILCCMRGDDNEAKNLETVRVAAKLLGQGVVAVDLAGAEGLYPTRGFEKVFSLARELGVPFTVHAGEDDGADSIRAALEFGAARIGHGVRLFEDKALLAEIAEKQIPLEMCPTSNFQTSTVKKVKDFPLKKFLEKGVCCTVNTDNPTVSSTTLREEFEFVRSMGITEEQEKQLVRNSIKAAFISPEEKSRLEERLL